MFPYLNNKKVILTYKDNVKLTAVELQHKLLFCVGLLLSSQSADQGRAALGDRQSVNSSAC